MGLGRVTPYYRSLDGAVTVYHCSIEDLLSAGVVPIDEVSLISGR